MDPAAVPSLLDPRGPIGAAQRTILIDSMAIMLAIVVPTIVATLAFAWWFRAGNKKARYLPDWAFSGRVELVVWFIPILTILLLGGVTWIGSHQLDPGKPLATRNYEPLEVQVVSLDWKWLFIYPAENVALVNELVIPAGRPLKLSLTSASVLNTFFVPQLGSMIYTMNGMSTTLWLQADQPGTFHGQSAHFSGDGFSDMKFQVRSLPAEGWAAWLEGVRARGGASLDTARYAEIAKQGSPYPPTAFAAVEPHLYHRIVMQEIAPAAGPPTDRGGAAEQPAPTSTATPR